MFLSSLRIVKVQAITDSSRQGGKDGKPNTSSQHNPEPIPSEVHSAHIATHGNIVFPAKGNPLPPTRKPQPIPTAFSLCRGSIRGTKSTKKQNIVSATGYLMPTCCKGAKLSGPCGCSRKMFCRTWLLLAWKWNGVWSEVEFRGLAFAID